MLSSIQGSKKTRKNEMLLIILHMIKDLKTQLVITGLKK